MTSIISKPEYVRTGIKIFKENGKEALLEYLKNNEEVSKTISYNISQSTQKSESIYFQIYCPSCGNLFTHNEIISGKITGGISGVLAGAYFGAQIGIAGGPFGAIAGTVPGAILGGIFGKNLGHKFDKPTCPKCKTSFDFPKNAKAIKEVQSSAVQKELEYITSYIIMQANEKSTFDQNEAIKKIEAWKEKMRNAKKNPK